MRQVERARALLDVPWVHQGRDPAVGIDCVGLVLIAFEHDDPTVYGREPHGGLLESRLEAGFGPPAEGPMRVGDVALMAYGRSEQGARRHVGIIADYAYGGLSIIHTDSVVGRVVEQPIDAKWMRRIKAVYR